jgi:hypothetical protein
VGSRLRHGGGIVTFEGGDPMALDDVGVSLVELADPGCHTAETAGDPRLAGLPVP